MASSTKTGGRRSRSASRTQPPVSSEKYFRWLVDRVQEDGHRRYTYWGLFQILYNTEYIWNVPNDDNRLADGYDVRVEFFRLQGRRGDSMEWKSEWRLMWPVSTLEVLVGLSRRVAWVAPGSAEGWAWQLLCNLELHKFRDPLSTRQVRKIEDILYALMWRTYDPDGTGGFFPLTRPREDQRQVEIWYQMHAYVREINPM